MASIAGLDASDSEVREIKERAAKLASAREEGQAALQQEIDILLGLAPAEECFLTSTAPASIEVYRRNEFYKSEEEFVFALAEAILRSRA